MLAASAAFASGCIIETHECEEGDCPPCPECGGSAGTGGSGSTSTPQVVLASIDTNATLDTTPGEGIGAFVEYEEGGRWHVYTACDTQLSGLPCYFNVIATLPDGSSHGAVETEGLEYEDGVYEYEDGVELATVTENGIDGMYFEAPPGGEVRFEVYLDDEPDARFIYWVGGGAVHNGAPSNPIDLEPTTP